MKLCLNCKYQNQNDANFCSNCNTPFLQPKKSSNTAIIATIAVASVIVVIVLCGLVGAVTDNKMPQQTAQTVKTPISESPPPTPKFSDLKLLAFEQLDANKSEYSMRDIQEIGSTIKSLQSTPKDSEHYKEANEIAKKLNDRSAYIAAEIVVLGEKPSEIDLKLAFNNYLRDKLNDYSSSEYVDYSMPRKVYIEKEPFWVSTLKLRAKNAFGAYVLQDFNMYIRNKKVVAAEEIK